MRRLFIIAAIAVAAMWACSEQKPSADEMAGRTAKLYYDYLVEVKYDAYVDGFFQPDSIPGVYREQLIANAKMFAAQQHEERKGIASVRLLRARADTARHVASAYLLLCYGDSTREEIVVPMVEHKGVWMMK